MLKATFLTFIGLSMSMGAMASELRSSSYVENLKLAKDLIQKIQNTKNAPQDYMEAYNLKLSIDDPIISKNRRLGYCIDGFFPIGRRFDMDVPFRIGRKKSCEIAVPLMLSKGQKVINETFKPFYGNAIKLKMLINYILVNNRNLAFNNIKLYRALKKVQRQTFENINVVIDGYRYSTLMLIDVISKMKKVDTSIGYRDYAVNYRKHLAGLDSYILNFKYDNYDETLKKLNLELSNSL